MKKKSLALMLAGAVMLVAAVGCGTTASDSAGQGTQAESTENETTFERAQRLGYVTVGFANENPYAYETPDGKLTGEAVEVARAILKELGISEMRGKLTEFSNLIPSLNAGHFDMVTAGMFIRPDRCEQVAFANPEYRIGEALAVKEGNPLGLHSYEDIASNPDATVAVMGGAVEHDYMKKVGVPDEQIMVVQDQPAAIAALKSGRADAITMTGPSLQAMLNAGDTTGIERVMDFKQPVIDGKTVWGYGATAFRKADKDFLEAFNRELQKLKESGKLLEIIEPFGFTEAELPGDVTAAELCAAE